jgi:hypothetical protein
MRAQTICGLLILVLFAPLALAQDIKIDPEHKYFLLAAKRTHTMEKELNEVADQGFRVLVGSPTSGAEMAVFMERVATPPKTYKYKLLATTRTGTMNKELNEAAEGGWRLLPRTMISKASVGPFSGVEIVVLLEKAPDETRKFEYKLLATNLTGTLQREVTEAIAAGYTLAGMVSRGERMVIMEKGSPR